MKDRIEIAIIITVTLILLVIAWTSQLSRVSQNPKQEANNFNLERRLNVINIRTDKPILELIGYFSIKTDTVDNQLEITMETGNGEYKIYYIYLNEWTMYTIEDISGSHVDKYHYEVNFLPQTIQKFAIVSKD